MANYPVTHPGGSDVKVLDPGSYGVTDKKYSNMKGTITVDSNAQSNGDLTLGGFFVTLPPLYLNIKRTLRLRGYEVLSTFDFLSKTVQKDINGPTTLMIYSTHIPITRCNDKLQAIDCILTIPLVFRIRNLILICNVLFYSYVLTFSTTNFHYFLRVAPFPQFVHMNSSLVI